MSGAIIKNDGRIPNLHPASTTKFYEPVNPQTGDLPEMAFVYQRTLPAGLTVTPPNTDAWAANPLVLKAPGGGFWVRWWPERADFPGRDELHPAPSGVTLEFDTTKLIPNTKRGPTAATAPTYADGSAMRFNASGGPTKDTYYGWHYPVRGDWATPMEPQAMRVNAGSTGFTPVTLTGYEYDMTVTSATWSKRTGTRPANARGTGWRHTAVEPTSLPREAGHVGTYRNTIALGTNKIRMRVRAVYSDGQNSRWVETPLTNAPPAPAVRFSVQNYRADTGANLRTQHRDPNFGTMPSRGGGAKSTRMAATVTFRQGGQAQVPIANAMEEIALLNPPNQWRFGPNYTGNTAWRGDLLTQHATGDLQTVDGMIATLMRRPADWWNTNLSRTSAAEAVVRNQKRDGGDRGWNLVLRNSFAFDRSVLYHPTYKSWFGATGYYTRRRAQEGDNVPFSGQNLPLNPPAATANMAPNNGDVPTFTFQNGAADGAFIFNNFDFYGVYGGMGRLRFAMKVGRGTTASTGSTQQATTAVAYEAPGTSHRSTAGLNMALNRVGPPSNGTPVVTNAPVFFKASSTQRISSVIMSSDSVNPNVGAFSNSRVAWVEASSDGGKTWHMIAFVGGGVTNQNQTVTFPRQPPGTWFRIVPYGKGWRSNRSSRGPQMRVTRADWRSGG